MFDSFLGIDFKEDRVILSVLKGSIGRVRLINLEVLPFSSEENKEEQELLIKNKIHELLSKNGIRKDRVIFSIPRDRLIYRFIRFPPAVKENLRKVIEYESPKYVPFEKGEVLFDFQILKEDKEGIEIFSAFAKKKEIEYYLSLLKSIGVKPQLLQVPIGSVLTLFQYHQKTKEAESILLIEMEKGFWEINILKKGILQESILLPMEEDMEKPNLKAILHMAGMKEEEIKTSRVYIYGRNPDEKKIEEIGLKPIQIPLEKVSIGKKDFHSQAFYTSIGLPLCGLTKPPLELNLLPMEMRIRKIQIWKPVFYATLFITLLLSILLPIGEWVGNRAKLQEIKALENGMRPEVSAVEALEKERTELLKEVSEFEKIAKEEISKIEILKEITKILPPTVWVWNLKYKSNEIEINGFADSASDLIPIMDRSPWFEKVEFSAPITKEKIMSGGEMKEKERFKIKARIEGTSR